MGGNWVRRGLDVLVVATLVGAGWVAAQPVTRSQVQPRSELFDRLLQRSYRRAVRDAYHADASEIEAQLWSISPDNSRLHWREDNGDRWVLVNTWTAWDGYNDRVGSPMTLNREIWVTPVPQVRQFGEALDYTPANLTLRLEQYLGLPPDSGKTKFVELWVQPRDLFRPCPDAEIDDTRCELQFSDRTSNRHQQWVLNLMMVSYQSDDGYPWTRLGYTYDWGSADTEVGASEFLVREGARVRVVSVTDTADYFE